MDGFRLTDNQRQGLENMAIFGKFFGKCSFFTDDICSDTNELANSISLSWGNSIDGADEEKISVFAMV